MRESQQGLSSSELIRLERAFLGDFLDFTVSPHHEPVRVYVTCAMRFNHIVVVAAVVDVLRNVYLTCL